MLLDTLIVVISLATFSAVVHHIDELVTWAIAHDLI